MYECGGISIYRSQLMGIAAIGILMVHSLGIVDWPFGLNSIVGYGGTGVYIFVFLSAIGLYHSLKSRGGEDSKCQFYKRRFMRLMVPYGLIAGTWYGSFDLVVGQNPLLFLYDLSTLSFWMEHEGAWYVAMLIPIYLFFPWFYGWVEKEDRTKRVLTLFWGSTVTGFLMSLIIPSQYHHLAQVVSSVIVFLLGYYWADHEMTKKKYGFLLSIECLVIYVVKTITPLKNFAFISNLTWAMLGIPIMFFSAWILNRLRCKWINGLLAFFGKYSLETYLCNIFMIQAARYFGFIEYLKAHGDTCGYIVYSIIIFVGVLLSVVYGKLSVWIVKRYMK